MICLYLLPFFYEAANIISEYSEEKRLAAIPLPAFGELKEINGEFEKFVRYSNTYRTSGGASIRLKTGESFYLSEAMYSILHETYFEQIADLGDEITLWVSYQEQTALDGRIPVIFQISLGEVNYLYYEQTYKEILEVRERRIQGSFPILLFYGILFLSPFFGNLIYYKWTGKIPKWALKVMKGSKEFEDIDIEMGGKFIEPIACETVKDTEEIRATVYGKVCSVEVECGQQINSGDAVVILAALQMQIPVSASMDGVVEEIYVHEGDKVEKDALLILIRNV